MPPVKASQAHFWFEVGGQPADTFQVTELYGIEAILQPFRYELQLVARLDADVNLPDFLNTPATLTLMRLDQRKEIHGILSELEETGRTKDYAQYHGVLVPRMWKLSLTYQSRIFQNQSVPDILKAVFKDAGLSALDYDIQASRSYSPREYCVQYRETDLNFINRLMEYEGMYYFFEHSDGKDVLVIVDDKSKEPRIESPDEIDSYVGEGVDTRDESIRELTWHEKIVTGKVILKDYNYRTPETMLKAESQIDGQSPGTYYEYGEHFKTASEGESLAKIRNQELEAGRRILIGVSDCQGFHAGHRFTLNKHYRDSLNGDYLLTRVVHTASQGGGIGAANSGTGGDLLYSNQFTCIPADVQFRPPRTTPEPKIPGVMTARVETAGGDYAHIDDQGRYFVKMPFDISSTGSARASRPIRLAQPYSGPGYGIHFPNRANTEMVWACVDGNVDRPLGLSTVPNASNSSPSVAANKPQCVIRTAGQNELRFDDAKGSENVYIHGTKDWTIDIVNNKAETIGGDESTSVGGNRSRKVGGAETITVSGDRTLTVEGGETISIGKGLDESVGANMSLSVGASMTVSVAANKTESINNNSEVDIAGNSTAKIAKDAAVEVGGNVALTIAKKTSIQSGDDFTLTAQKKAVITAADELTLKCGDASIILKKNGDISIKGNNIAIKGSGDVTIKGSKIAEN